jgi:hypothetical protein
MGERKNFNNYNYFHYEIRAVVKPELLPIISELEGKYPLIKMESGGNNESGNHVRGFVWNMFICKALYNHELKGEDPPRE